jgi:uncharacterized SAM-binding protein YcdF (DUF218 family)
MIRRRSTRIALAAGIVAFLWFAFDAGELLVIDVPVMGPQAIVSLASHEWERLPETARLARENPQAVVLLTQPAQPNEHNCYDCPNRVKHLVALGVPAARIKLLARRVGNTYDEAMAVRELLQQTGVRRILVVTSMYHTRRSLAAFRHALLPLHASIGVAGAPWPDARPERWWTSAYGRWYVTREWAATLYYSLRHSGLAKQLPLHPL